MRLVAAFACAVIMICLGVPPCLAEKRVALVVGNAAYRNAPVLTNPKNDAEDVGRSLKGLGFETIVAADLDRSGMNDALDHFSREIAGADIALVYYSGHGMQFGGKNYLLPVDARLASADDVNRFRLLPLDDITDILQAARGARVIVLDACRNNPVEDELKRRLASMPGANRDAFLTRGLGRISSANGLLVAYATQASDVAADGTGRNSPFTAAFLRNVGTPEIDLRQMFFRVQDEVDKLTGGRQRPELSISLVGEFKLKAVITSTDKPQAGDAERAWADAKDTNNQAVLEEFIRRFGDSFYAALARARLEELKRSQNAVVVPPVPLAQPPSLALFGTADEAKAMLNRAVAELKINQAEALAKFPKADSGYRDRDLYVFCFNATDGKFTAHVNPTLMGTDIRALKEKSGNPLGQKIFDSVKEGSFITVAYNFTKPGSTDPVPKEIYVTKVANQGCGVGYYR